MSVEENKAIVRNFLERGNIEERTPTEYCSPRFTAHIGDSPSMDLRAFQEYQTRYFAGFSNSHITIEDVMAEGDRVAFRGIVRTTHTGEFAGISASGTQISVSVIGMARLVDGKIDEWWNSPDRLSWMQQIGAIPSSG